MNNERPRRDEEVLFAHITTPKHIATFTTCQHSEPRGW